MFNLENKFLAQKADEIKKLKAELKKEAIENNRDRENFFILMTVDSDTFEIVQHLDMGHTENDVVSFY